MLATGWWVFVLSSLAFFHFSLLLSNTLAMAAAVRNGQMAYAYLGYTETGGVRHAIIRDTGSGLLKLLGLGERLDEDCVVSAIGESKVELQCDQGPSRVISPLVAADPSPPLPVDRAGLTAHDLSRRDTVEGAPPRDEVPIRPEAVRPEAESSSDVSRIGMLSQAGPLQGSGGGIIPSGGGWLGGATGSGSTTAFPEGVSGGPQASGSMSREEILRLFEQGRAKAPKEEP